MKYLVIKIGTNYVSRFNAKTGEFVLTQEINEAIHYNSLNAEKFMGVLMNACDAFECVEVITHRA